MVYGLLTSNKEIELKCFNCNEMLSNANDAELTSSSNLLTLAIK